MSIQVYNTPEAVLQLGECDPQLSQILLHTQTPVADYSDIQKVRDGSDTADKVAYEAAPSLGVEDHVVVIPMRDGHQSSARVFRTPSIPTKGSALVVLVHGGGFILGSNLQLAPFARAIAATYGATIVTLSYRLAPEHPFPIPGNDVWDGLEWAAKNAESIGADPSAGFIVGGASAGANLAVTSTHLATEKPLDHKITGLWLVIPALMSEMHVPKKYENLWLSRTQCADAPALNSSDLDVVQELYAPDETSPRWSPYNMPASFSSSKLPKTSIHVAGLDPLRDDGLMYARTLDDHGVKMRLRVYPGVPHGFVAWPQLEATTRLNADVIEGFGWMLGREEHGGK